MENSPPNIVEVQETAPSSADAESAGSKPVTAETATASSGSTPQLDPVQGPPAETSPEQQEAVQNIEAGVKEEAGVPEEIAHPVESLKIDKRVKAAFEPFDTSQSGWISASDLGTVLRTLNIFLSEAEVQTYIKEIEEPGEAKGTIQFAKLQALALRLINDPNITRDAEDKIYNAFRTLDKEKKGYLTSEEMRTYLMTEGEAFSEEEVEQFLHAAIDPIEQKILYESFANKLATC